MNAHEGDLTAVQGGAWLHIERVGVTEQDGVRAVGVDPPQGPGNARTADRHPKEAVALAPGGVHEHALP